MRLEAGAELAAGRQALQGPQEQHQRAEADQAGVVAQAMPRALAGLAVTVGSELAVEPVVAVSLVALVVEVVEVK